MMAWYTPGSCEVRAKRAENIGVSGIYVRTVTPVRERGRGLKHLFVSVKDHLPKPKQYPACRWP